MYRKIALAIAFSPRMEALIAETKRLIEVFDAELLLIHVGEKTTELEEKLDLILETHALKGSKTCLLYTSDAADE